MQANRARLCHSAFWVTTFTAALILLLTCIVTSSADARSWQDGIAAQVSSATQTVNYRYYLPDNYDPAADYPLVLFLHGSGERGRDNMRQVSRHISGVIDATYQDYPAILVAPQAPLGTGWTTPDTFELTDRMLKQMIADFRVDTDRLYITGLSMGGFGTIEYLYYYANVEPSPFQFAAGVPLSAGIRGVVDLSQTEPFNDTPVWLMHGDRDGAVPVDLSRNAFRSFTGLEASDPINFNATHLGHPTAVDNHLRYTEIPGGGHNIWSPLYTNSELYDWMFDQSLAVPEPQSVVLVLTGMMGLGCIVPRRASGANSMLPFCPFTQ